MSGQRGESTNGMGKVVLAIQSYTLYSDEGNHCNPFERKTRKVPLRKVATQACRITSTKFYVAQRSKSAWRHIWIDCRTGRASRSLQPVGNGSLLSNTWSRTGRERDAGRMECTGLCSGPHQPDQARHNGNGSDVSLSWHTGKDRDNT